MAITDANLSTSDITTNNATTAKHGFLPKLSNVSTEFLDGTGAFSTPAGGGSSGWNEVSDTWTYASASTITIPTDGTTIYQKWMKIRLKQGGGYKYYVATTVAATLITVLVNTSYTVANAAITDVAYSFIDNPYGFPTEFLWTTVLTNLTVGNGTLSGSYKVTSAGQISYQWALVWGSTTSIDAPGVSFSLPATASANYGDTINYIITRMRDANLNTTYQGTGGISASATTSNMVAIVASGTYATNAGLQATVPFTWTTSDSMSTQGTYFAA